MIYLELGIVSLQKLKKQFQFIRTIVIDEISMVSSTQLTDIHRRMTSIKNNDLPFGGCNVIVVGDFFQLKPVMGTFAYKNIYLWPLFTLFILKQNMRQSSDILYAQILNRIKIGSYTQEDVNVLKSRLVTANSCLDPSILHIYPTKIEVESHNSKMQSLLTSSIHKFTAQHIFSNNDIGKNQNVSLEYIPPDDRDAGGLPLHINLSVGTKVMLIRNLNVEYGLVNGAHGTVTQLNLHNNSEPTIDVVFPDIDLPSAITDLPHSVKIMQYDQEYLFNGRYIIRRNFPLLPCWATTIHKVPGLSLDKADICIGATIFQRDNLMLH